MERLHLYMPFEKSSVDKEKRIVWGIATTETPDLQGDIMSYEGSKKAFKNWERNCREMHTAKAVGQAVRVLFDDKKRVVRVGVYVSKGAQDTWDKVLDGTLRGFSIGGYPTSSTPIKKDGKKNRLVNSYVLEELSLVDTPANPECEITAITKRGNLLVATEVLGHLPTPERAGDAITLHHEVKQIMGKSKRQKVASLVTLSKSLTTAKPDEKIMAVPMSAFTKNAAGEFVLDMKAHAATFTKGELDGDGYDDSDPGSDESEPADIDFGEHATNLANCHSDLVKAAGLGDPVEHYENAIGDSADDEEKEGDADEASPYEKNRSGKRARKGSFSKRAMDKAIADAVKTAVADVTTAFEAKFAEVKNAGGAAPRQGEGVLVKRADGSTEEPESESVARLKKAYARRDEINAGATASQQERGALAREIAALEVASTEKK